MPIATLAGSEKHITAQRLNELFRLKKTVALAPIMEKPMHWE
jgi:hypothetical protein